MFLYVSRTALDGWSHLKFGPVYLSIFFTTLPSWVQMKEVLSQIKSKNPLVKDAVVELLTSAHHCIKVHVALVNLTKSHEKVIRFNHFRRF